MSHGGKSLVKLVCILTALLSKICVFAHLSSQCQNSNQDYAWNHLEEVVRLGGQNGVLMYGSQMSWCVEEIVEATLMAHHPEPGSESEKRCNEVREEVEQLKKPGIPGRIEKNSDIKFMLIFNKTLYYLTNLGFFTKELNATGGGGFNFNYLIPNIGKWIEDNFKVYQISSIVTLRTSNSTPKYPSAIVALNDPQKITEVKYFHFNPDDGSKSGEVMLGHFNHELSGMYLQDSHYTDTPRVLVFFEQYYGRMVVSLNKESHDPLVIFPILPAQYLYGCPVHLCWFPLAEDIVYHPNHRAYYFFQGKWVFRMMEGETNHKSFNVENAYNLEKFQIRFQIHAACYDYEQKSIVIIRKNQDEWIVNGLTIDDASGQIKFLLDPTIQLKLAVKPKETVLCAVHLNESDPPLLWMAIREPSGKIMLRGYRLMNKNYELHSQVGELSHKSITALFYHPQLKHIFMVSGFFLYVYQEPIMKRIKETNCSVTSMSSYFNCSDKYYNMKFMNPQTPIFESKKKYFEDARKYHLGKFLPDQCNYKPELTSTNFQFEPKLPEPIDLNDPSRSTIKFLWYALVLVLGIALVVLALYGLVSFRRRRNTGRSSAARKSKENKFRQFLKQRYFNLMSPVRGKGKRSSPAVVASTSTTTASSFQSTTHKRDRRNSRSRSNNQASITSLANQKRKNPGGGYARR